MMSLQKPSVGHSDKEKIRSPPAGVHVFIFLASIGLLRKHIRAFSHTIHRIRIIKFIHSFTGIIRYVCYRSVFLSLFLLYNLFIFTDVQKRNFYTRYND